MSHVIIISEAIEALENKMSAPPTAAQQALHDALHAADEWYHDNEENAEITAQIDDEAIAVKGYCDAHPSPQDNRLQNHANTLNGLID